MTVGSRAGLISIGWEAEVRRHMSRHWRRHNGRVRPVTIITEEEDGQLCWGAPQDYPGRSGINWDGLSDNNDDEKPEESPEEQRCLKTYNESSRAVTMVRVENPEDSSQYVMVERIDSIVFQGNDCSHKFTLNWG